MKKIWFGLLIIALPILSFAQFKEQTKMPSFSQLLTKPTSNLLLGFLDPEKLEMHHSFSMSYMSMGGKGLMVNSYMNTITYQFSTPLTLRMNLGLMNSPYNSFNNHPALNTTQFFGGAELNYRPSKNALIRLGIDMGPGYYFNRYNYDPYYW
ncbi:MAG: hypothetical protein Kow0042_14730 [Calditrichia bacterium]